MNTHTDKTQENKSQSVGNAVSQNNSESQSKSSFQFVDNRPEAVAHRKPQEMANNSLKTKRVAQLQAMADNYSIQQQHPIQKKENNTGLPENLKTGMESLSGMSLDHVKVHYNSSKPDTVQAHAYAQGSEIHLANGQEKHLPHELAHVIQQAQGRVKPTTSVNGIPVNDSVSLEKEADSMGTKALQMKSVKGQLGHLEQARPSVSQLVQDESPIQRAIQSVTVDYGDDGKLKVDSKQANNWNELVELYPELADYDPIPPESFNYKISIRKTNLGYTMTIGAPMWTYNDVPMREVIKMIWRFHDISEESDTRVSITNYSAHYCLVDGAGLQVTHDLTNEYNIDMSKDGKLTEYVERVGVDKYLLTVNSNGGTWTDFHRFPQKMPIEAGTKISYQRWESGNGPALESGYVIRKVVTSGDEEGVYSIIITKTPIDVNVMGKKAKAARGNAARVAIKVFQDKDNRIWEYGKQPVKVKSQVVASASNSGNNNSDDEKSAK